MPATVNTPKYMLENIKYIIRITVIVDLLQWFQVISR